MRKFFTILISFMLAAGFAGAGMILDKNHVLDYRYLPGYDLEALILLRNSVFARYGYIFKSSALREYFTSLGWYKPDKNFSFAMLSALDQRNVNAILEEEKKKVNEFKRSISGVKYKTKRYFLTVREKERVPPATEGEIRKWWQKKAGKTLYPQIRVPVLLTAVPSDEKDAVFISGRIRKCPELFPYWEAGYDEKGRLRVLRNCYCESGWPNECGDVYYFDDKGKLLMVQGRVRGTTVNYEYYYQYCLDSVVWIEVTLINGSAGIPDETEKFFY